MIRTSCTGCGKRYQFDEKHAGKSSKCPACGAVIAIPAVSDEPPVEQTTAFQPEIAEEGPKSTSGMAIASLVCGILGFCCFPAGIIGLVLGIIAIKNIDNPANNLKGRGLAQAGAIIGGVSMVIGIVALLIGIFLPALGAARRTARQMQNSTQLRGVHQGHILFSQGNNTYYAGLDTSGDLTEPITSAAGGYTSASQGGGSNGSALLLNGNYFTPAYLVNPAETNHSITPLGASGEVSPQHYSFAVSRLTTRGDADRRAEWKDNTNTQAVILSDRVLDFGNETAGEVDPSRQTSVWTTMPGDWRGGVVYGDNSTTFMTTSQLSTTKYGTTLNTGDNLFVNENNSSSDALQTRD